MRWWRCAGWVGLLIWAYGCQQDKEPPPRSNIGIQADGRTMLPLAVPSRKHDKAIIAPAANADEAARESATPAPAEQVTVDDSTAEGVIDAYVEMVNRGLFIQLPSVLVAEQQEIARTIAEGVTGMVPTLKALEAKWQEKFPDAPLPQAVGRVPQMMNSNTLTKESVEAIDDNTAEATLQVQGVSEPLKVTLRKVDAAWRVEDPNIPTPEQLEQIKPMLETLPKMAEAINGMVQRIDSGDFDSAAAAEQALYQSIAESLPAGMAEQMKQAAEQDGSGNTADELPPADGEASEPQPATPPPTPNEPNSERGAEDVDGTYSGPGQLRTR